MKPKEVRQTETQEQEELIEGLAKEFRMKGHTDDEAYKLAKKTVVESEEQSEKDWQEFIKKINLHSVLDDLMRRAIIAYKEDYNKRFPDQPIDFKLSMDAGRGHGKGAVFQAVLKLEVNRGGEWVVMTKKRIVFEHIKDTRKEASWKFAIYEAMFQGLMFNGITHMIMSYDATKQSGEQPKV